MGNEQSSSSSYSSPSGTYDPEYYAEWKDLPECDQHGRQYYKVTKVRWVKVPMADAANTGGAAFGRGFIAGLTLGLSELAPKKDLTHECLEFRYYCERCSHTGTFTAEIRAQSDKRFNPGYYSIKAGSDRNSYCPSSMTISYAENRFDEMGTSYDMLSNNCYHWSKRLWDKL